jgi:hypothetical protein
MDAYLDHLLDELVTVDAREGWEDVLDRARRSRRRYLAAVTLVAALVLTPAAWAIGHAFEGKPAPPAIKAGFRDWNRMDARFANSFRRKQPKAIVSKAHGVIQVRTADGPVDLWAAPARGGGTCYFVGWESDLHGTRAGGTSSCVPATEKRWNTESSLHGLALSQWTEYTHRSYKVVEGYAYGGAKTIRVTYSNGRTKTLPVVEGLFLGALHQSMHWRQRPKIVSVTARSAQGEVVGYWRLAR